MKKKHGGFINDEVVNIDNKDGNKTNNRKD